MLQIVDINWPGHDSDMAFLVIWTREQYPYLMSIVGGVSFDEVIQLHSAMIARIAVSFEANFTERQDLQQDILLAVWRALPNYRGEASLKTFVASIAQRRAVSHVQKAVKAPRTRQLEDVYIAGGASQEDTAIQLDLQRRLTTALRELPVSQREAAVLLLEGFNYSEIGTILGVTSNAATLRCQRARQSLQLAMEGTR